MNKTVRLAALAVLALTLTCLCLARTGRPPQDPPSELRSAMRDTIAAPWGCSRTRPAIPVIVIRPPRHDGGCDGGATAMRRLRLRRMDGCGGYGGGVRRRRWRWLRRGRLWRRRRLRRRWWLRRRRC